MTFHQSCTQKKKSPMSVLDVYMYIDGALQTYLDLIHAHTLWNTSINPYTVSHMYFYIVLHIYKQVIFLLIKYSKEQSRFLSSYFFSQVSVYYRSFSFHNLKRYIILENWSVSETLNVLIESLFVTYDFSFILIFID